MDMTSTDTSAPGTGTGATTTNTSAPGTGTGATSANTSTTGTGTNETFAHKLFGDLSTDIPDATYRFIADSVRSVVFEAVQPKLHGFEHNLVGQQLEQIVGYVLAAALEVAPGQWLLEQRQRLAQNLRVQVYQEFEDKLFQFTKESIREVVARREGEARGDVRLLLEHVREMLDRAQERTDRKIDEAIERMGGGPRRFTAEPC